jgi:methyl-accepting chemotaxis protein
VESQSKTLAEAVNQILSNTQQVSAGAQDQSKQVQHLLSAMESVASSAEKAAGTAVTANDAAHKARDAVTGGTGAVSDVIQGIQAINAEIKELARVSARVGEIVQVSDQIADRTNLLALNAAIEAARTEDSGQGFGVVAAEVRRLAEHSRSATREIAALILEVQKATEVAQEAVNKGINQTSIAREKFEAINNQLNSTLVAIREITRTAREQAESSVQMVGYLKSISKVVDKDAESAGITTESTRELAQLAEQLRKGVELFQASLNGEKAGQSRTAGHRPGKIVLFRKRYSLYAGLAVIIVPCLVWAGLYLTRSPAGIVAGGILGTAGSAGVFYLLAGSVAKAVKSFKMTAEEHLKGNITVPFEVNSKDELDLLGRNFMKLAIGLARCMAEVEKYNLKLVSHAGQILNSTEQLSSNSQDQAVQIQELLNGIETLAGGATNWAEQAAAAAISSSETDQSAREGEKNLALLRDSMKLINRRMEELGESSRRIGQITTVINDIADQTNLMALNAAIEAARAGSNGRGFAVVAEEVRKLAENSAASAREIASLVGAIQAGTGSALQSVEQGIYVSEKAGEAFNTVTRHIGDTRGVAERLAELAREQASVTSSMVDRIQAISAVVQQATAVAEETSARSQELTSVTKKLEGLTKVFKLKRN